MDALSFIFAQLFVVLALVAIGGVVYFAYQANLQQQQKAQRGSQADRKARKGEKRAAPAPAPQPVVAQPEPKAEEPEEEPEPAVAEKVKKPKKKKAAEAKPAAKAAAPAPAPEPAPAAKKAPAKAKAAPAKPAAKAKAAPAPVQPVVEEKKQDAKGEDAKKKKKKKTDAEKKKLKEQQAEFEQNIAKEVAAASSAAPAAAAPAKKGPTKVADGEWAVFESKSAKRREAKTAESDNKPTATEKFLKTDPRHYSAIIGQGGQTVKTVAKVSGAQIIMPKKDSMHDLITIKGSPTQVAQAEALILELAEKGYTKATHPGWISITVHVPPDRRPTLIGEKGSHIKSLQEGGARIHLPRDPESTQVTISGTRESCEKARDAIETLLAEGYSTVTHKNYVRGDVDIPSTSVGLLIGPKGATIQKLQMDTKTRINIPKDLTDGTVRITIIGEEPKVLEARRKIMDLLEAKEEVVELDNDPENPWNAANVNMANHDEW